jgi:hypothetical protein
MANNVTTKVLGGQAKVLESFEGSVADLKKELGLAESYQASINGSPAENDKEIEDYAFVTFAPAVKGA